MNNFQITPEVLNRRAFALEESLAYTAKSRPESIVFQARIRILIETVMSNLIGDDRVWMLKNVNETLQRHQLLPDNVKVLATGQPVFC